MKSWKWENGGVWKYSKSYYLKTAIKQPCLPGQCFSFTSPFSVSTSALWVLVCKAPPFLPLLYSFPKLLVSVAFHKPLTPRSLSPIQVCSRSPRLSICPSSWHFGCLEGMSDSTCVITLGIFQPQMLLFHQCSPLQSLESLLFNLSKLEMYESPSSYPLSS